MLGTFPPVIISNQLTLYPQHLIMNNTALHHDKTSCFGAGSSAVPYSVESHILIFWIFECFGKKMK